MRCELLDGASTRTFPSDDTFDSSLPPVVVRLDSPHDADMAMYRRDSDTRNLWRKGQGLLQRLPGPLLSRHLLLARKCVYAGLYYFTEPSVVRRVHIPESARVGVGVLKLPFRSDDRSAARSVARSIGIRAPRCGLPLVPMLVREVFCVTRPASMGHRSTCLSPWCCHG